jgi:hypothetical protein
MKRLWVPTLILALLPLAASAQANPDSIKNRNDCRLAVQVITTGQPAVKTDWAMTFVRDCSEFPAALARALREARASRDTGHLNRLTAPADWLRDGGVYSAAYEVLRDRTASPEARVFAIRVLMWAYLPGMELNYSHLVDTDGDGYPTCGGLGPSLHGEIVRGMPLPAGWEESGRALGRSLALDGSEAVQVQQAARCLALAIPFPYARDMP